MDVVPPIPKWSFPHPDAHYICAHRPNNPMSVYRFEYFVPEGWVQVSFQYTLFFFFLLILYIIY